MTTRNQFDERYFLKPKKTDNIELHKRSNLIIKQQKAALTEQKRRPSNISWFENLLDEKGAAAHKPLVGFFCNTVPLELIYAMGALPLRLCCGNAAMVQAGEEVLHGEICPLVKSSFAESLDKSSAFDRCAVIILSATCDPKRKLGELLSDLKPVFLLNLPPEQDFRRYAKMMDGELQRMIRFLKEHLGTGLNRKQLINAINIVRERTFIARNLQELRAEKPEAISIKDSFIILQSAYFAIDPNEWIFQAKKTIDEIKNYRPARLRMRPRIVLTGAPIIWPNFKLLTLIEESGADVVADTLCGGFQSCGEAVSFDETGMAALIRALSSRYVFGSLCPCFISQGTRISRILELVNQFKADGVINHGLRLCQLFDMEVYRLAGILKSKKIAFVNIRTDYSLEDREQLRVRIEAFLETVGEK